MEVEVSVQSELWNSFGWGQFSFNLTSESEFVF